jgi:hypothetical protein
MENQIREKLVFWIQKTRYLQRETKTKPTFQIYSKIIRQLYTVILPDLLQADRTLLNNAYENFQKEYVKNKSKMTDNLLDF